jgi:hypothetical protein
VLVVNRPRGVRTAPAVYRMTSPFSIHPAFSPEPLGGGCSLAGVRRITPREVNVEVLTLSVHPKRMLPAEDEGERPLKYRAACFGRAKILPCAGIAITFGPQARSALDFGGTYSLLGRAGSHSGNWKPSCR